VEFFLKESSRHRQTHSIDKLKVLNDGEQGRECVDNFSSFQTKLKEELKLLLT